MFCTFVFTASCKLATAAGPSASSASSGEDSDDGTTDVVEVLASSTMSSSSSDELSSWGAQTSSSSSPSSSEEDQVLLFIYYVWSSSKKPSSSNSSHIIFLFVCRSWHVPTAAKPAGVCPLLPSVTLIFLVDASDTFHFHPVWWVQQECQPKHSTTWRSEWRWELIISSHLISFHLIAPNPPEMSYTTRLSDIKQSIVQIRPPNKKNYIIYISNKDHQDYGVNVLIVEVVRASIHRFPDGHMLTIDCPKAMMVLPSAAVGVGADHPIIRSGRNYDDLFMVGIHYGRGTDLSYQHTDCVVCNSEIILQSFGTVCCSHVAESDGHLQSWV